MDLPVLKIAVVGHTNTGKTSLVRTLTHDRQFGEVRDRGGTTRQITSVVLEVDGQALIELNDTPGLENAPELIEWLDDLPGERHDGPERIERLLRDGQARRRFDQECRVLELMGQVDVGLYVIDAREPVLEKYLDELAVLGRCARPLVMVLNFTAADDSREDEWRQALARLSLHSVLAFDAVIRDPATEYRLFEKLKGLLDAFAPTLKAWMAEREREDHRRQRAALAAIADLLIDVAACRRHYSLDNQQERQARLEEIRQVVRRREQVCVEILLDLYRFGREDYQDQDLPLTDGRWPDDLFDPQTLAHFGIHAGTFVGAGAGAGLIFDISTAGLSLGAGTLVGTLAGAGAGLAGTAGKRLVEKVRGTGRLGVDDPALRLLAWRQLCLLAGLVRRGHASIDPLKSAVEDAWKRERLPAPLRRARHHPEWSTLNRESATDPGRDTAIQSLIKALGHEEET
jgi:hypothetical protein